MRQRRQRGFSPFPLEWQFPFSSFLSSVMKLYAKINCAAFKKKSEKRTHDLGGPRVVWGTVFTAAHRYCTDSLASGGWGSSLKCLGLVTGAPKGLIHLIRKSYEPSQRLQYWVLSVLLIHNEGRYIKFLKLHNYPKKLIFQVGGYLMCQINIRVRPLAKGSHITKSVLSSPMDLIMGPDITQGLLTWGNGLCHWINMWDEIVK